MKNLVIYAKMQVPAMSVFMYHYFPHNHQILNGLLMVAGEVNGPQLDKCINAVRYNY